MLLFHRFEGELLPTRKEEERTVVLATSRRLKLQMIAVVTSFPLLLLLVLGRVLTPEAEPFSDRSQQLRQEVQEGEDANMRELTHY